MKLLEGKVALITGAARGIGKAIAVKYASQGANIAFTDLVIDENTEATKKELESYGVKVVAIASNAASFDEAHKVVEDVVKEFGKLDILVIVELLAHNARHGYFFNLFVNYSRGLVIQLN